jgi:S1-C subfamily serine protease
MMTSVLEDLSNALADAAEKAGKSTVQVDARRRIPASGIVYAADLVLTADHVVERDEEIHVTLFDGTQLAASVAGRDPGSDLAVLRLERAAGTVAEPSGTPARIGQFALVLGRPSSEGLEASLGIVSAIDGPVRTPRGGMLDRYFRTDAISYPGFSGGPTVAADGAVLGLNTSGFSRGASITIPVDFAWKTAADLAAHGHIRRGYLGIRSQPVEIPAAQQAALQREQPSGLLVVGIENDSPASRGGLMVGDILVSVNGSPVSDHDELFALLTGDLAGKPTPVEVLRGGAKSIVNVVIGER